ncbi:inositol monophosphatase 1-like isoform X2 [Lineus longissimus]|uniref:inositol monophosphatase 1-like isoform X2 n=1 Tax=Lineus longissimus TaxID=88925 RepID=UPI002B4CA4D5
MIANEPLDLDKCFEVGKSVAIEAGKVIKEAFKKEKRIEVKGSAIDLVTETDQNVEKMVISTIKENFPTHCFIGEESTAAGVKNELTDDPTWIIDPIDGTTNFVHTFPYTCISIGLLVNKKPVIGLVYSPVQNEMYTAQAGKGAFCNDERIYVSSCKDLQLALILTDHGYSNDPTIVDIEYKNMRLVKSHSRGIRSVGSAAMSMCLVASGAADGYYEYGLHCWDIAAGVLLVEEAGGINMDPLGGPLDIMSRGILCTSSKELAEQISKDIQPIEFERD